MIVGYGQHTYEEAIQLFKKEGVPPAEADNLGISYQHIFWELKSPKEFLEKSPEYKGKKIIAIEMPEGKEIRGQPMRVKDENTGLINILSRFCEKEDIFNVTDCKFHNLKNLEA
ncbi:MAG: hypothetical protein ABFQ65_01840 [Nanoarchaeota archaeon]